MPLPVRVGLALLVPCFVATAAARAQFPVVERPEPFTPTRPETRQELNHREAVKLYGLAALHERNNRFLDAVQTYEAAIRLDPDAAPPYRALVSLYLALDRLDDALEACRKALDLDPGHHATWHLYGRQLRAHKRTREAAEAFARALACPSIKDHPEQHAQVAFDLGSLYEDLQEYAKAERAFLEVVQVLDHPAHLLDQGDFSRDEIDLQAAETYERLGIVCVRAAQLDRATAYFVKARDKIKSKDEVRARRLGYHLAEVHMARKEWAQALAALDDYLQTRPQDPAPYRAKIKALEQLGRRNEVLAALQGHVERDAHNIDLQLLLAERYREEGKFTEAEAVYQKIARTSPRPEVYRGLFQLYMSGKRAQPERLLQLLDGTLGRAAGGEEGAGDPDAAAQARAMLVVLREEPRLVQAMMPVIERRLTTPESLSAQTTFYLGVLAARTRQLEAAEKMLRNCLNGRTARRPAPHEPEVYSNLLRVLRMAHKHEAIIEVCRQGLGTSRATSPVLFRVEMAQSLGRLGRFPEALDEAKGAVEAAPDPSKLFCRRVRVQILSQAGRHEDAVREGLQMLKEVTAPEDVRSIRHLLSIVYSGAKEHAKAEEQLRTLLETDANDATANNDLGYIWADQGKNLDEAEKLIRKALDLDRKQRASGPRVDPDSDRDNAAYIDSLGWVLFRKGDLAGARRELEKAVSLPDGAEDPVVWDHLADVLARQGEAERAATAWRKAIELYDVVRERHPDERYTEIQRKLKLLERDLQR